MSLFIYIMTAHKYRSGVMSHYFTGHDSEHNYKEIEYAYQGKRYTFKTDRGVFSKDRIDYGSAVLIDAVIKDRSADAGGDFIDMGAGYGPIGIVIGDVLDATPLMIEVNPDGLLLSKENASRNRVAAEVKDRSEYDAHAEAFKPDFYVTNPPFRAGKDVVLDIIEDAAGRLEDGAFYMVVQKKQGMPSYRKAIQESFGNVETLAKDKGYYVLKGVTGQF
ncbi:class I SAM-dependent methyltransferase [Salinicoccus siamensis]